MKKNIPDLSDFIYVYRNAIPHKVCDDILKENFTWSNKPIEEYESFRYNDSYLLKQDFNFYMSTFLNKEILKTIKEIIYEHLKQYVFYDLSIDNYCRGWYNFTDPRLNKFSLGQDMPFHCDHVRSFFDGVWRGVPVYSICGFLNDDYSGGDFLFWGQEKITTLKGDIVIFPSNFLFPHETTKITNGNKYTFSSWAY